MNIFKYVITYYEESEEKMFERKGLVCAKRFDEAVAELTKYYGEQETNALSLEFVTDSAVIEAIEIPDDIKLEG